MRRKIKSVICTIACLIAVCGCATIFIGCGGGDNGEFVNPYADYVPSRVPEDIVEDVKDAYYAKYGEEILEVFDNYVFSRMLYYGEYNNCHVLLPSGLFPVFWFTTYDTIDDITFFYHSSPPLDVYYAGSMYQLKEAYENEFLSHDDLLTIRLKFNPTTPLDAKPQIFE